MMTTHRLSASALLTLALAACGSSSSGTGGAGGGTGGSASGDCNMLANVGQSVSETADPAAVPAMTGGTIADGTYVLVSNVQYAGSTAGSNTHKRTLQITGTTIQMVNSDDGGPDVHVTFQVAPAGNEMNENLTCPTGIPFTPGTYTATATTLAIQKHGTTQVETYDKQ